MKNINKGLGYIATAIVVIVTIIFTKNLDYALLFFILGFIIIKYS